MGPRGVVLGILLLWAGALPAQDPPADLVEAVHALPRLEGRERAGALQAVLARKDAPLELLVAACRALPACEALEPGLHPVPDGALLVPAGYDPRRRWPLLLAVGATGVDAAETARYWASVLPAPPALILVPEAPQLGQGWTFAAPDRARVTGVLAWARTRLAIDPERVFIAGYSRGGHAAWGVSLREPDPFAGVIALAGGLRLTWGQDQNNFRFLENLAAMPLFALIGRQDDPMLVWNVEEAGRRLAAWGAPLVLEIRADAGHLLAPAPGAIGAWLEKLRRPAAPARVVLLGTAPCSRAWAGIVRLEAGYQRPFKPAFQAAQWNAWDKDTQRRKIADAAIAATARLELRIAGPGRIEGEARGVRQLALRAGPDQPLADAKGAVELVLAGRKPSTRRLAPSRRTLLEEWARRPDPGRLVWSLAVIDL